MSKRKQNTPPGRAPNDDPNTIVPAPAPRKVRPDWTKQCEVCGATPIVPATGMCGPCTFGEADTAGGNW